MNWFVKTYEALSKDELYDILQLRTEIFVVEQDCVYQDMDGKDRKSLHVFGVKEGAVVAYSRIFKPGDYFNVSSIGRVIVKQDQRKFGYGHDLMKHSIRAIKEQYKETTIQISAQCYLEKFYKSHDFQPTGREYLEDGIPHMEMVRK